MNKRTAVAMGALVVVLGVGLVALRRVDKPPTPRPASADAAPARSPAPARPARPSRARPSVPSEDATSGVIDGRVIDGVTHEGVPDAELTLLGEAGASTFRTSSDGTFELTPPPTGSFALATITAPGYLPYAPPVGVSASRLILTRGQAVTGVTLVLYPVDRYEGKVVDAQGAAVAGARVRLLGRPGEPALEELPEWRSGVDGKFRFQAGSGSVLEASRGALVGVAQIDRNAVIMKQLTIRLGHAPPRDETITGWVRDIGGAPLAGARVRGVPSEYYTTAPTVLATAGADGRFTLAGVERAPYDVTAELAEFLPATSERVPGGSHDVALTLDRGLALAGRVIDRDGAPVASFKLVVQRHVGLARAAVAALSVVDPQGRFDVRVSSGDYDLIASAPGHPRTAVQAAAGATDLRIVLGRGAIVRGKVIDRSDGAPIADAFVSVDAVIGGRNAPQVVPATTTRADGAFELEGLSPGPVGLRVGASGYGTRTEELPAADKDGTRPAITIALGSGGPERGRGDRGTAGIGVAFMSEGTALRIVRVLPSSGALAAGLSEGDLIIAINGVPVAALDTNAAIDRIRGPAGTTVTLTVRRSGRDEPRVVERRELPS